MITLEKRCSDGTRWNTVTWAYIGGGLAVGVAAGTAINVIVGGDTLWARVLASVVGGWSGMTLSWVVGKRSGRIP